MTPALVLLLSTVTVAACERQAVEVAPRASEPAAPPSAITVELALDAGAAAQIPQAVKDLSLSAKRDGSTWTIGGHQLHVALAGHADLVVDLVEEPGEAKLLLRTTWARPLDPPEAYAEIQDRLLRLARKIALFQSVTTPRIRCTVVATGGAESPCADPG